MQLFSFFFFYFGNYFFFRRLYCLQIFYRSHSIVFLSIAISTLCSRVQWIPVQSPFPPIRIAVCVNVIFACVDAFKRLVAQFTLEWPSVRKTEFNWEKTDSNCNSSNKESM